MNFTKKNKRFDLPFEIINKRLRKHENMCLVCPNTTMIKRNVCETPLAPKEFMSGQVKKLDSNMH